MSQITIKNKNGKEILSGSYRTVKEIYDALYSINQKWNANRIRLTTEDKKVVLSHSDSLKAYKDGDVLIFKDLGPQVSWKMVFFIEYFGPMVFHFVFYMFPAFFYGSSPTTRANFQTLGFFLSQLHFLKRELETELVHRFSNATMPWTNLPKNCFHYHILGGLFIAYPLYSPNATHYFGEIRDQVILNIVLGVWLFAELSNLVTHIILRNLRPEGSTIRKVPKGYGFDLVSCPNYFFEILGWICYSVITGSLTSWFFTIVGAIQMYVWALKKHQRYKKEFGKDYPKRKVLIPFVL